MAKGRCMACGEIFSRQGMQEHLMRCEKAGSGRGEQRTVLMMTGGRSYWMFAKIRKGATLKDLDEFLRDMWLECCGHLSSFTYGEDVYLSHSDGDPGDKDMKVVINRMLDPGDSLIHQYDYGSPTRVRVTVMDPIRDGSRMEGPVELLARNEKPVKRCVSCGNAATWICTDCSWHTRGDVCDSCVPAHECGEDMLMSLVNSPRTGVCGYDSDT